MSVSYLVGNKCHMVNFCATMHSAQFSVLRGWHCTSPALAAYVLMLARSSWEQHSIRALLSFGCYQGKRFGLLLYKTLLSWQCCSPLFLIANTLYHMSPNTILPAHSIPIRNVNCVVNKEYDYEYTLNIRDIAVNNYTLRMTNIK